MASAAQNLEDLIGLDVTVTADGQTARAYHVHDARDDCGEILVSEIGERRRWWMSVKRPGNYRGPFLHMVVTPIEFPDREVC